MSKIKLICDYCSCEFERYKSQYDPNKKHIHCSKQCYYKNFKNIFSGENNPNHGKKWTDDDKKKQSILVKERMDLMGVELRTELCGKSNRGQKRSLEFLKNWHSTRNTIGYICPPISDETRKKISIGSSAKFNKDFKIRFRRTMEEKGIWVKIEDKKDFEIYYSQANWKERMWDLVEDDNQIELLKRLKVFNSYNNIQGVVRDHRYGRKSGFENGIFPEILRHPCNCQIITHSANAAKRSNRYIDRNDISIEDLFDQIEKYSANWVEQQLVLEKINDYKDGKRWKR